MPRSSSSKLTAGTIPSRRAGTRNELNFSKRRAIAFSASGITTCSETSMACLRLFTAPSHRPPPLAPPHKGEGNRPSLLHTHARPIARTVLRGNPRAHARQGGGGPEEDGHRPAGRCRPRL